MSDHVMSVMSVLALQPSSFHITGGRTKGESVQRDLLHLHDGSLFLFVGVGESDTRGGILPFATHQTGMFACICQGGLTLAEQ